MNSLRVKSMLGKSNVKFEKQTYKKPFNPQG